VEVGGPMKRQLHLNLFIHSRGHHEASWRQRGSSPLPLTDIRYYQDVAQPAEAALFDSIFLADQLALGGDVWRNLQLGLIHAKHRGE
jgi:alkanesulfonate monooxygenase SsuD/methylene tetrahydromethanopterin reductase-like flavin-dependent oxidoreductase (luciferase family)